MRDPNGIISFSVCQTVKLLFHPLSVAACAIAGFKSLARYFFGRVEKNVFIASFGGARVIKNWGRKFFQICSFS